MRKTIIVAAAAALVVSGIFMSPAPKAEAHHNTITVAVSCTTDYRWQVLWKVENSENLTETITASSDPAMIPVGTELGKRETRTFVEFLTAPVDKVLSLAGKWSNGQSQQNTGTLSKSQFVGVCEPPVVTPEDASASATPQPATCEAPGVVTFEVVNADWIDPLDLFDGERVAVAHPGHLFPGGLEELTVVYQVNPELAGEDCGEHEPCPGMDACPTPTPTPTTECDPAKGECFAETGPLTPEDTARLWFLGALAAGSMLLGGGLWWNARRKLTAE